MPAWAEVARTFVDVYRNGSWVPASPYVLDLGFGVDRGRQTEADESDPSQLTLTFNSAAWPVPLWRIADTFSRTVVSDWGTADTGHTWSWEGGSATDYNVAAGAGSVSVGALNNSRRLYAGSGLYDVDVRVTVSASQVATGDAFSGQIMFRHVDTSNMLNAHCRFNTDGTISGRFEWRNGGDTTLAEAVVPGLTYTVGTPIRMRLFAVGPELKLKLWAAGADEPDGWHVEATDSSGLPPGPIGLRSICQVLVTNPLPVVFTYDDFEAVDPTRDAGRFTTGAIALEQAMPIRVYEVIAGRRVDVFSGEIETVEVASDLDGGYEHVAVTAIDRLGRLGRSPAWVSTIGAAVTSLGGEDLTAYYPLNDATGPVRDLAIGRPSVPVVTSLVTNNHVPLTFGNGDVPPGDDLSGSPVWNPVILGGTIFDRADITGSLGSRITVGAGHQLAMAAWVNLDDTGTTALTPPTVMSLTHGTSALSGFAGIGVNTLGEWTGQLSQNGSGWSTVVAPGVPALVGYGRWLLVSFWSGLAGTPMLAVNDQVWTGSVFGSPPTSVNLDNISIGIDAKGSIAHVQVYLGAGAYTLDDHLEQYEVGITGLAGQRTDERMRSLARFAGLPPGVLDLDVGATFMQRARLGGKRPMEAMTETVDTEQGRWFASGDDRLAFHSRRRVYNV